MPIRIREYTYSKIEEFYKKESEAAKKASGKSTLQNDIPKGPNIKPASYTTKARK